MNKVIKLGTVAVGGRRATVFCKIEVKDGKLSISGVEGPLPSGNALGACGQIDMHLRDHQADIKLAKGWTREMLGKFFEVWQRWHLNDLRAGTLAQEAELKKHTCPPYPVSHYDWACDTLRLAGLLFDGDYKYGSAWLREEVPQDVIAFLESLPESDTVPSWV